MRLARQNSVLALPVFVLGAALALTPAPWAASPPAAIPRNPYELQLAGLVTELPNASAARTAVMLRRIYELRDFVDDTAEVAAALGGVAADSKRPALVRDEAQHWLALIDLHENRLDAARAKLAQLGFVRQWAIVGPFSGAEGLDAEFGPEQGFSDRDYPEGTDRRRWRLVPDFGPNSGVELDDFFPQISPAVVYAATSLFTDSPRTLALRISADSALAVFVNGREVLRDDAENVMGFDQHAVGVELHKGWNAVVLKLYRRELGAWGFAMRVTGLSGGGLRLNASANRPLEPAVAVTWPVQRAEDLLAMAQSEADITPSAENMETAGRLQRDHGRGSGVDRFEAATRLQPNATRWLLVARSCGQPACRFAALNAAQRAEPDNAAAALALAEHYAARQQSEKARDILRAVLARAPGQFTARQRLADLYAAAGLNALALGECRRLEAESPQPLYVRRQLAARYEDFGMLDRAQVLLESELAQNWDGAEERALLARIYARRHDATRLRDHYVQASQLRPTDTLPMVRLAELAAGKAETQAAETYLRAALDIAPEGDELHQQLAEILAAAGKSPEARQELARALELNPQLAGVRRRLQVLGDNRNDPDAPYLADVAQLAREAGRAPADANAVLLADVRVERVFDHGLSSVRTQQVFYIANEQGARELATRSVQYTPDSQLLEVLHARIHKSDGRIAEAEDAGEETVAETGEAMYYDVRSRSLRFPGLEPGDVLELDYRVSPSRRDNLYGDYFGDLVVFGAAQPEKLKRFVLVAAAQRRLNVLEERMPAPAEVTVRDGHRTYVWEARDLQALPNEPRSPAVTEIAPYVNVSTFNSWADLGRWYAQLVRPQFALDGSLRDALARILDGKKTELEKIRAIHGFVLRNTHYVALEFGIYGYKPYPVSQTYARRFGDCKDKASLMIALLRAAGIEADIALVRTRRLGDIDPRAASISVFNHAVAYLPRHDLWLDGTAEYAGSRELPLEDQGALALTISAGGQSQLRRIPVTRPDQNYTRRTVYARIRSDGTIHFSGSAYIRGEDAPGLRREYELPERQRQAFRDHLAEIFPSVRLDDVQVDGADDLEQDINVNFRGTLDTFAGQRVLALTASWMRRAYVQQLAPLVSRRQPLLLPAPWTTEEEIHFTLPEGTVLQALPPNSTLDTPFGAAALQFEQRRSEIIIRTSVQFRRVRIRVEEYGAFRDFCDELERAFRSEVKVGL